VVAAGALSGFVAPMSGDSWRLELQDKLPEPNTISITGYNGTYVVVVIPGRPRWENGCQYQRPLRFRNYTNPIRRHEPAV